MNENPEVKKTAGQDFIHRIGPAGCVLFLALFVLTTVLCFTTAREPIAGYEAPHEGEYYVNHLDELAAELNENVLPQLEVPSHAAVEDGVVVVTVEDTNYSPVRSAVLRYFDSQLLQFRCA